MTRMPLVQKARFKYIGLYTFDTTSVPSSREDKIIRTNSLYDPDFSGTGEQPVGYD